MTPERQAARAMARRALRYLAPVACLAVLTAWITVDQSLFVYRLLRGR